MMNPLARTVLRAHASPEALAVIFPGNPSYADQAQLDEIADQALAEVIEKFKAYPG